MILNLFLALPVVSGLAIYFMKDKGARAFGASMAILQLLLGIELAFQRGTPEGLTFFSPWIPELGLNWSLGLDGANVLLVLLTPIITALAVLSMGKNIERPAGFVASLLVLDGFLCGVFLAQNLGLFYIFFEAMLLPALILIGGWSRKDGPHTALKFLMYTLVGSLPMLLGVLALAFSPGAGASLEFADLGSVSPHTQLYLFFPFLLAFLIKMPMVPLHGWLPTLYRNAPASVTVVIAALMSKAGTYGLFKVGLTVFPDALRQVSGTLVILAVASILYGAFAALGADSIRDILAYSSLSHIGMIALGIASLTLNGASGAGLQMAGHAVATGGLFLVVAFLEARGMPDQIRRYGGLSTPMPRLAALALFLTLASLGQPGLGSFPGELFILSGSWRFFPVLTVLACLGILLAAAYLLRWYQRIFTGEEGTYRIPVDLSFGECTLLIVPIGLSLAMGFFPIYFMTPVQAWLEGML